MPETITRDKNPRLAGYLDTTMRTTQACEWLIELMERFHRAAPEGMRDRDYTYACIENLRTALDYYKTNRASGADRRGSYENLFSTFNSQLHCFARHVINPDRAMSKQWMVGSTPETLEEAVNAITSEDAFYRMCDCGANRRTGIKQLDGHRVCESCASRALFSCPKCKKTRHHQAEDVRLMYDNKRGAAARYCEACLPESTRCTRCDNAFIGQPANGQNIDHRQLKEKGHVLCAGCGQHMRLADCGCITDRTVVVNERPNVEDDNRTREQILDLPQRRMCGRCAQAQDSALVDYWEHTEPRYGGRSFKDIGSKRTYGVELEVSATKKQPQMSDELKGRWTAKGDASLPRTGVEFASTVLRGDEGLRTIADLCQYAAENKWSVDACSGFHLHIGVNDLDSTKQAAVAMGYLMTHELWCQLVAPSRGQSKYCAGLRLQPEVANTLTAPIVMQTIIDPNTAHDYRQPRRVWCNWHSLRAHGTVEIRLHQGTLVYEKIANWIKAHTRFVDWCVAQETHKAVFAALKPCRKDARKQLLFLSQAAWKDREMGAWFRARSEKLHGDRSKLTSHRRLRQKGFDPKAVVRGPDYDALTIQGKKVCYFDNLDRGTEWYLTNRVRGPSLGIGRSGIWGELSWIVFGSLQEAQQWAWEHSDQYLAEQVTPPPAEATFDQLVGRARVRPFTTRSVEVREEDIVSMAASYLQAAAVNAAPEDEVDEPEFEDDIEAEEEEDEEEEE